MTRGVDAGETRIRDDDEDARGVREGRKNEDATTDDERIPRCGERTQ